ncbi:MAG TPA: GTP cyclohydrolase II [Candidatus Saccharimonadales bacterium]|jgi:GTP cyclohydrolase II|nr:GTP cyclohydrolase II [Candidatus Saccharimonadales bacterium]
MTNTSINLQASSHLPTKFGDFRLHIFTDGNIEHLVLASGTPKDGCLVRLHSECATGDIMGSLRCDCRDQLELSLRKIAEAGEGLLIYIRDHEGRGIGLANKIKAYALQDEGMDTVDANLHLGFAPDQRDYAAAISILRHFGLHEIKLLTNNRRKIDALEQDGIKITRQVPLWTATNPNNEKYVATKRTRMGHI